ncbi:MAG: NAD(P)-dependent alcohol dehydrogenase [Desulfobacterales bacterium]|nr:NAD(P)-dependent alcohol dehydrogenase [Desulfobacterales bacterium]
MKALIYNTFGKPDVLEWKTDWPDPVPGPKAMKIKVAAGSVNPKDVLLRKGKFSKTLARTPLPRISGMDIAGEVVEVGTHVTHFKVGDPIFGMTNEFSGGLHSQYALLDENEANLVPKGISLEDAAAVPLSAQTALQALRDLCGLEPDQRILINGASGGVGHFAIQIAKTMGAEVHAVCGAHHRDFVQSMGADHIHHYETHAPTSIKVRFHAVFDVFGNLNRRMMKNQLKPGAIFVSTVPRAATLMAEFRARVGLGKTSRLVEVQSRRKDLEQIGQWMAQGQLSPHIHRIYPPEQAREAHRQMETKHTTGKIILSFLRENVEAV